MFIHAPLPTYEIPALDAPDPSISPDDALRAAGHYDSTDNRSCCKRKCE